ncbi:hypothetical protein GALL_534000 [mine drainage metagenome]|uniref:Uncharacterized protein n=1 Tax=mine drainage metagenome TaxID=410659 RepID=A0A1J5PNA1_9ZZZZ
MLNGAARQLNRHDMHLTVLRHRGCNCPGGGHEHTGRAEQEEHQGRVGPGWMPAPEEQGQQEEDRNGEEEGDGEMHQERVHAGPGRKAREHGGLRRWSGTGTSA